MRLWRVTIPILSTLIAGVRWSLADIPPHRDFYGFQNGAYGDPPQQTFRSSDIIAPVLNYGTWNKALLNSASDGSSHIFLTLGYEQSGPYVFSDEDLGLVYADPSFEYTMNARVQTIDGTDYLSFWHGARNRGDSQGFCVFYDQHYRLVFNVTLGPSFDGEADMHECEVTPDGNVLVTAYLDKPANLSPLGGEMDAVMADGCFQEVNPATGDVMFSWCASESFDVRLGYWDLSGPSRARRDGPTTSNGFDVYHINSLQKTTEGHYLVSLRNLKMIAYVNGETGAPIWKLGGKSNEFLDITPASTLTANPDSGGALSFGWQHDVKFLGSDLTQITMFDNQKLTNSVDCNGTDCSRGRWLRIDTSDAAWPTVELIRDYRSPHHLTSVVFGSMQALPNPLSQDSVGPGSFLTGWGVSPEFTEHSVDGELVRDVLYSRLDPEHSFAGSGSVSSYRVYKQSWRGYPTWPPEIAITRDGSLYASWNGATEVRSWVVYRSYHAEALGPEAGSWNRENIPTSMEPWMTVPRTGFETEIERGGRITGFVKVVALDAQGGILGISRTVATGWRPSLSYCLQWYKNTFSYSCLMKFFP